MKTKFRLLVAALAVASVTPATAAVVNNSFTVSVNLSSRCIATNSGVGTLDFGTYTAFQGSAAAPAAPVTLTFDCTRGLAPVSVAFDTTNGSAAGVGVLAGLQYSLSTSAATTVAGIAASTSTIGSADAVSYSVNGTMPALQAGTCGTATCAASHTRTLIVTY
jgi:spore coat protein U-like protein